jgi:hypothetical protein
MIQKRELDSRPKVIAIIKEFFAPLRCHSGSRISKQMALHGFDEALVPALVVTAWFTNNGHIDLVRSHSDAGTDVWRPPRLNQVVPRKLVLWREEIFNIPIFRIWFGNFDMTRLPR